MAKINARGARELASVICERKSKPPLDNVSESTEVFRARFVLRSDGVVLIKLVTVNGEKRNGSFSQWRKLVKPEHRTRDILVKALSRYGWQEVTAETLSAEHAATTAAAVAKRCANMGPVKSAGEWRELCRCAHAAGMAAGEASVPEPMVVQEHANPLDDRSPVVWQSAPIMDGPCGFAYVTVRPANGSFGRWAKENGWRGAYGGGIQFSVDVFNQSVTRKGAYAAAFAEVLREAGVSAYSSTRMD